MLRFGLLMICLIALPRSFGVGQPDEPRVCFTADAELAGRIRTFKSNGPQCLPGQFGCGSRGGPGYRSYVTGDCVGWDTLIKDCGPAPHRDCFAECLAPAGTCTLPQSLIDELVSNARPRRTPDDLEQKPERRRADAQ